MDNNLVPLLELLKASSQKLKDRWCKQLLYKLNIIHNSFENVKYMICFDNLMIDRNNNLVLINVSDKPCLMRKLQDYTDFKAPELVGSSIRSKAGDIWAAGICIYYINNLCFPWKIAANTDKRYCMWANEGLFPSSSENSYTQVLKQMLCVDPQLRPSVKDVIKSVHKFEEDQHDLSELLFF